MATAVKIKRTQLVALLKLLNFKSAAKMKKETLISKARKMKELVTDGTAIEDVELNALADQLIDLPADAELEIENDAGTKEPAVDTTTTAPGSGKTKTKAKDKDKGKDAAAEGDKPEEDKKPKEPSTPGVRKSKTRPFLAGQIIREVGHDKGVTPEMVATLNERFGKENNTESEFALRNAWHAIRGWELQAEEGESTTDK